MDSFLTRIKPPLGVIIKRDSWVRDWGVRVLRKMAVEAIKNPQISLGVLKLSRSTAAILETTIK